jgi:hypothetical protein
MTHTMSYWLLHTTFNGIVEKMMVHCCERHRDLRNVSQWELPHSNAGMSSALRT